MGDLRPDGNGLPPDDGGSHRGELPDFPPEWGPVIIPDDASELDDEAQALRREMRRRARKATLRSVLGIRTSRVILVGAHGRRDSHTVGIPVVIMAVAVLTTLISLFVVTWGHQSSGPSTAGSPTGAAPLPVTTTVSADTAAKLDDITLTDATGHPVKISSLLPAVILLVDHCDCANLVPQVAALAPAGVTVVPVAHAATSTATTNIHALADPDGHIRALITDNAQPVPLTAVAALIDRTGALIALKPKVESTSDLATELAKLGA